MQTLIMFNADLNYVLCRPYVFWGSGKLGFMFASFREHIWLRSGKCVFLHASYLSMKNKKHAFWDSGKLDLCLQVFHQQNVFWFWPTADFDSRFAHPLSLVFGLPAVDL